MLQVPLGWPDPKARPLVKICGLSDPLTAFSAVKSGADMIGLVYFEPSPRHIGPDIARDVATAVRGTTFVVLLTVDASDKELDTLVRRVAPDALQLHGSETPERAKTLGARYDLPVSKAIGVAAPEDLFRANQYPDSLLLVDAKPPAGATRPGGLGATFDWSMLTALDRRRGFMLSGGLDATNVGEAVRRVRPYAVDVSSGVETAGKKDTAKIKKFIDAVGFAAKS